MPEAGATLSLIPQGDPPWSVEHSISGRIRIKAPVLVADEPRCGRLQEFLLGHEWIQAVDISPRIGSVTVRYSSRKLGRREIDELLQRGLEASGSGATPPSPAITTVAGDPLLGALLLTLAATPFLPLPLRYVGTLLAISPSLWNSVARLDEGGGASRALDSSALLLTTLAGRYGVAQVNNLMHTLGQKLEQQAVSETESQLRQHGVPPASHFHIQRAGESRERQPGELVSGDRLSLSAGALVPLECMVLKGEALITAGFSTDEITVSPGHRVAAGSCLEDGELELVCLQAWSEGNYARLASFIEIAIRNREDHDHYAARLADRLVPFTMMLSGAVYGITRDLARASSALQADFSAAHELVTPVSVETTIAAGAARGILYRGGSAIERLAELDTLVFDRSGTLTRGEWRLAEVIPVGGHTEETCRELLSRLVIACCRPGAREVLTGALPPLATLSHAEMQQIEHYGLHLRHEGSAMGLTDLATAGELFGVPPLEGIRVARIGVLFCLIVDGACAGIARFSDALSPGNIDAVEALREQGIDHMYLVSHEKPSSLHPELAGLPLDGFHTDLSELGKLHFIQDLLDQGHRVGLVSDGLFRAGSDCVNICLGAAPDARPLDADVWLMQAGVRSLASAHSLARHSTTRLKRSHRTSQVSKGSMLLASSFDLLPPSLAAAVGNAVTLGMMRYARDIDSGDTR